MLRILLHFFFRSSLATTPFTPTADRVAALVDEHAGVVVKADDAAILPLHLVLGPHDHGVPDVTPA